MFEKTHSISAHRRAFTNGPLREERAPARALAPTAKGEQFESRGLWRAGDALRAVEWSEITARLNAARDLRLLLRNESQAPIEAVAASFGDAAASYFALLDDSKLNVNPDALGQSKALGATLSYGDANRSGRVVENSSAAARGDAREMQ